MKIDFYKKLVVKCLYFLIQFKNYCYFGIISYMYHCVKLHLPDTGYADCDCGSRKRSDGTEI